MLISAIKLQAEEVDGQSAKRYWKEGAYLVRSPALSSTNGIVLHPRLCITIDPWDSLTLVGEPSDLIKGPFLTHLQDNNIKMGKFRHIANK